MHYTRLLYSLYYYVSRGLNSDIKSFKTLTGTHRQNTELASGKIYIQPLAYHDGCVATTGKVYSSAAPILTFGFS